MKRLSVAIFAVFFLSGCCQHTVACKRNSHPNIQVLMDTTVAICSPGKTQKDCHRCGGVLIEYDGAPHVITARHCIADETINPLSSLTPTIVIDDDIEYNMKVVKQGFFADLALLEFETGAVFPVATIGDKHMKVGDTVHIVSCPMGECDFYIRCVVAKRAVRGVLLQPRTSVGCDIAPGHSGGGVYDGDGKLVGIVTQRIGPFGLVVNLATIQEFLNE